MKKCITHAIKYQYARSGIKVISRNCSSPSFIRSVPNAIEAANRKMNNSSPPRQFGNITFVRTIQKKIIAANIESFPLVGRKNVLTSPDLTD